MSLCICYHINALELVGGIVSHLANENPRSRMFSPCRGFPFIVWLLVPEAVENPHNRVHSQLNNTVAYEHVFVSFVDSCRLAGEVSEGTEEIGVVVYVSENHGESGH